MPHPEFLFTICRRLSVPTSVRIVLSLSMLIYSIGLWRGISGGTNAEEAFDGIIEQAARRHALPPSLIKAVIRQESNFKPWAAGRDGEIGLMQITRLAVQDWERHSGRHCPYNGMLRNPRLNIEIGSWYLAHAFDRWSEYRDVEVLALAQYNAGGRPAGEWAPDDPREGALERVRFSSTRQYIKNVMAYRREYLEAQDDEQ